MLILYTIFMVVIPFSLYGHFVFPNISNIKTILLTLVPWVFTTLSFWYDCVFLKNVILTINLKTKSAYFCPPWKSIPNNARNLKFSVTEEELALKLKKFDNNKSIAFVSSDNDRRYIVWESDDIKEVERVRLKLIVSIQNRTTCS